MKDKIDNPPAFPIPNVTDMDGYIYAPEAQGMSLRDYFAGQALPICQGIDANVIAILAYDIADAMLRER